MRRTGIVSYWRQYLAISPFFLVFVGFNLIPVFFTLYLAFQRWDGLGDMQFAGLDQFKFLVHDPTFWLSVRNTIIIWVLGTFPMLFVAMIIAVMLNAGVRFTPFYRIAYFLPNVTSLVAVALFFFAIFSSSNGLVNAVLHLVHLPQVQWLQNPFAIKVVIALLMSWQWTGYNAIIYLAGLQTIPNHLYEAAQLDGAGPIRTFFSVTVPLLRPVILFTVVISTITGMQSFTEAQVMTGSNAAVNPNSGGPGQGGLTMVLYFYQQAFSYNDFGYGAAIAWGIFLIVSVFTVINWRLVARRED